MDVGLSLLHAAHVVLHIWQCLYGRVTDQVVKNSAVLARVPMRSCLWTSNCSLHTYYNLLAMLFSYLVTALQPSNPTVPVVHEHCANIRCLYILDTTRLLCLLRCRCNIVDRSYLRNKSSETMCQDWISLVFTHDSAGFSSCPAMGHTCIQNCIQCGCLSELDYSNNSAGLTGVTDNQQIIRLSKLTRCHIFT